MKEEKFPNSRKPSHRPVCGEFWNLRRQQHNQKGEGVGTTEYVPNLNCQQRSSPEAGIHHQGVGAGQGGAAEKAVAPHSSTLAWKIPWMEEPGRLRSIGLLRVGHD